MATEQALFIPRVIAMFFEHLDFYVSTCFIIALLFYYNLFLLD